MMMVLTHVIVLVIVGYTTASPYGYGAKGGAAAKADAIAAAGSYTGVGDIAIHTSGNTGYSGSFSKSYSSSSSASSASSSSSSFSYSGSGSVGIPGAAGGVGGCISGNCHETPAGVAQGSAAVGSQAYGGANAAAITGGFEGNIPSASYGHKYNNGKSQVTQAPNCGSGNCQENKNSESPNGSGTSTDSQTLSNAKAEASTGSDDCGGSSCNKSPVTNPKCTSGECISNDDKCTSKNCGSGSHTSTYPSSQNGDKKTCTSGLCEPNQNIESSPSIDYGTNDIQISKAGTSNSKLNSGVHSDNDKMSSTGSSCSDGNCNPSPLAEVKPNYNPSTAPEIAFAPGFNKPATHLTTPKLESPCTSPNCQKAQDNLTGYGSNQNTFDYSSSTEKNLLCGGGSNCGHTKGPYTLNSENVNNNNQAPSLSQGEPANVKPAYSQHSSSSYSPVKPSSQPCTPGIPGCALTQSVGGSSPPTQVYDGSTYIKPRYPHGSLGQSCAPGTPGCVSVQSDCTGGNCDTHPSLPIFGGPTNIRPGYSSGISSHYQNTANTVCAPGNSGCTKPSTDSECSTGNCDTSLYGPASSNIKPISSNVTPSTNSHLYPSSLSCSPGTAGCSSAPSSESYGGLSNTKPFGTSYSYNKLSHTLCAPGSLDCTPASTDCKSGHCAGKPSIPGYTGASNIKPSYSYEIPSSYPLGSACAPGNPGCAIGPIASGPSICASGTCGIAPSQGYSGSSNIKPSQFTAIHFSPKNPSNPSGVGCIPGTPNCVSSSLFSGHSDSLSHAISPNTVCSPGTPGCSSTQSSPGLESSYVIKPSYTQESYIDFPPYSSAQPSASACVPGSPGCIPSQIFQTPICSPGSPKCTQGSLINTGYLAPGYGASGVESPLPNTMIGSHGSGPIEVVHNKPSSGLPQLPIQIPSGSGNVVTPISTFYNLHNSVSGLSGSGSHSSAETPILPSAPVHSGIESPSSGGSSLLINNVVAASGTSGQGNVKDKPTYSGGFGGPAGILKPNEFNVSPSPSMDSKPLIGSATTPAPCISGNCHMAGQAPPSFSHGVSNSATQTSAVAAASANAVAYTGGFGGPPGLLNPYDGGKIEIKGPSGKQFQHSSPDSHQKLGGGSGSLSYSNGGTQALGSAAAQAYAGSIGSTGHQNSGCESGCGQSSDYNGSLGYSNLGALDDNKNIANSSSAGSVAKSVANTASGAGAFGGSYASSSASAHATAGSSVKGGYGRR